ncbi:MAG: hypothetical protein AAGH15_25290, partial [Myxococcota bacterium]
MLDGRWFYVALLALGFGCGDDAPAVMDGGGVAPDAGSGGPDASVEAPRIPWLAEGTPPIDLPWLDAGAPPIDWTCPTGWREASFEGAQACEPFAGEEPDRCAAGEAQLPGSAGCAPIGRACGDGRFPATDDVPAETPIVYVDAAATGDGEGSREDPARTLADGLDLATSGTLVVLGAGSYAVDRAWPDGVSLRGLCASRTDVVAEGARDAVLGLGAGTGVRAIEDVTIVSAGSPALRVSGAGARVELRGLALRSSGTLPAALRVQDGAEVLVDGLVAAHVAAGSADAFGIAVEGGASLEGQRVSLDGFAGIGLSVAGAGSAASLTRGIIRRTAERSPASALGSGAQAREGATLVLREVALLGNVETGIAASGAGTTATLEDLVVRGTQGTEGFYSAGIGILLGAQATAARVLVAGNTDTGIATDSAAASLTLRDAVVTGTQARDGTSSAGLFALRTATLDLERVAAIRNATNAIAATEGGNVTARDVVAG